MQEHKKGDQFTRGKFMWLDQVLADQSLPMGVFQVAYVIAKHVNRGTGDAWLGTRRLSDKAGVSRNFAVKAMRLLETAGHLAVENGIGRGNTNRYRMVVNGSRGDQEMAHDVDHLDEINGAPDDINGSRGDINGAPDDINGSRCAPDSLINPFKNPLKNPLNIAQPSASPSDSDSPVAPFFDQQGREAKEGREAQQASAPQGSAAPPRKTATAVPPADKAEGCGVPKRRRTKPAPSSKTAISPDIALTAAMLAFATTKGMSAETTDDEFQRFANYHASKATMSASWEASWRIWVLNHFKFKKRDADADAAPQPTMRLFDVHEGGGAPRANGRRLNPHDEAIACQLEMCAKAGF
jgi:hypothetical protein